MPHRTPALIGTLLCVAIAGGVTPAWTQEAPPPSADTRRVHLENLLARLNAEISDTPSTTSCMPARKSMQNA